MDYLNKLETFFIKDENGFNYIPNPELIKKRNWYFRMYIEYYDLIEASFITKAIKKIDNSGIFFYIDNGKVKKVKDFKNITIYNVAYYYSDLEGLINMNIYDSGISNKNLDYLFLSDAENKFFMLFGNKEFVQEALPVQFDEYKLYYESFYGNWASENIDKFMKRLWSMYPIK